MTESFDRHRVAVDAADVADAPTASSPLPDTLRNLLLDKRLVFSVTTGRSGTGYLARLLDMLPGVGAFHEPEPKFSHAMRQVQDDPELARRFWLEYKLPAIAGVPDKVYIETSHLFCKGFVEPFLEFGLPSDLILLERDPSKVALSLYQLNTVPGRSGEGMRFLVHPGDPGVLPLPDWEELNDYQLCYWYCLEIGRRAREYERRFRDAGARVVRATLDELTTEAGFRELLTALDLPDPDPLSTRLIRDVRGERVNVKKGTKDHHRLPAPADPFALEQEVLLRTGSEAGGA
jgi:hypothetical protein